MITHYGLFWSERDVYWGKQNSPGVLLGRERSPLGRRGAPTKSERDNATDYRDFVGLYCLYGGGELLYIGEAGLKDSSKKTLFERLKTHRTGPLAGRWDKFSWFGRASSSGSYEVAKSLAQLEAVSIAIINPGFNRQSGTFGDAKQVYQVLHESADGDLEAKIERLMELVETLRSGPEEK